MTTTPITTVLPSLVYPTKAAVRSMVENGLSWQLVLDVIDNPDTIRDNGRRRNKQDRFLKYQRFDIVVVVSAEPSYERHDLDHKHPLFAVLTVYSR